MLPLEDVGRLPSPNDNAAIATRRIEPGTVISINGAPTTIHHTVLEGHRFAVRAIAAGEPVLSWGLPFGEALCAISPGDYLANESMLAALALRAVHALLPAQPNFRDRLEPFQLKADEIRAAPPVARVAHPGTFAGYRRSARRGVGTRNCIVILGTTSRTAGFVRRLAERLQPLAREFPSIDGIVAIGHTEGGGPTEPNNAQEVLRTLAGFMVHPNVGAVLAVDQGVEPISNARLQAFMDHRRYPLEDVPHAFLSIGENFSAATIQAELIVRGWLPSVASQFRTPEPLCALRLALQCGGSDAFSGVSGNPLAGAVAHELIRHGGSANLCETDEAFGGEAHLLANVRDLTTAEAFLATLESFRERLRWHGETGESNPSGGNKLRGLYNISLKSLGAVQKKSPLTRLDTVIDYAVPMQEPGFYFMNSPGNDLEGIAGQIASGCNVIAFVTGNGSITNFPFAPTLKITTTTRRHELLVREMDVNAGRYLDGTPMSALVDETFALLRETASGRRTRGELAGHSQVSLWRDWRQTDTSQLEALRALPVPDGKPVVLAPRAVPPVPPDTFPAWRFGNDIVVDPIALIVPTSMCSSQVARLAAEQLTARQLGAACRIDRFVALPHTEGCGFGGDSMQRLLQRTYRGYAVHPNVVAAVFLEHGCEKVPNDVMRHELTTAGVNPDRFGWVSVQLDGGMQRAIEKISTWFSSRLAATPAPVPLQAALGNLRIGLMTGGPARTSTAEAFAAVLRTVVAAGGSVLVPAHDPLLGHPAFRDGVCGGRVPAASLSYGQPISEAGFHIVATETNHWVENLTGLGGCGVHLFLTIPGGPQQPRHPFLPVVQCDEARLPDDAALTKAAIFKALFAALTSTPRGCATEETISDFQLTRGFLGVSA